MFEWISDAVEWISGGISSLWDDTVGSVVNTVTDAIWDVMFEWIFDLIFDGISDIFEFINMSAADIFTLSWVQAFISLFRSFGFMLFVVGMLVAVFDTAVAYENGSANIKNTCINVIKGFMAASLFAVVPPLLYQFCISLQSTFSNDLLSSLIAVPTISLAAAGLNIISSLAGNISLYSLFFMILFGYCVIKGDLCKHQARRYTALSDSCGKLIYVRRPERIYRRIQFMVQAGHSHLPYSIFADNYPLPRAAYLHPAPIDSCRHLLICDRGAEDSADVRP